MCEGGSGGGGGFFDSIQNAIDQTRNFHTDVHDTVFGEEGKKWRRGLEEAVGGGSRAKDEAGKQAKKAQLQQEEREQQMADQETKSGNQAKFSSSRNRQRLLSGKGRSSTILTSPLGTPVDSAASSGKTLLGS